MGFLSGLKDALDLHLRSSPLGNRNAKANWTLNWLMSEREPGARR